MLSHTNHPYLKYSRFNQKVLQIHQKKKKNTNFTSYSTLDTIPCKVVFLEALRSCFFELFPGILYCFTVKLRALRLGFYSGVMNSNNCVGVSRKSVFFIYCEQAHNGTLFAPN